MPAIAPQMIQLQGATYLMGSADGRADEKPAHQVTIDSFSIARFPVTVEAYVVFLDDTGHQPPRDWMKPPFDAPDLPVCGVSWIDAVAYADWLSIQTAQPFHLPTEAQREYASRGGTEPLAYPWGDDALPQEGVYARGLSGPLTGRPLPVGTGSAGSNGFDLWHMGDNVHEWCADFYQPNYYSQSPTDNPPGPLSQTDRRAARGGSWRHNVKYCRCSARSSLAPDKHFMDFGFRLASSDGFKYVMPGFIAQPSVRTDQIAQQDSDANSSTHQST
jgi:sulfatase modifying factor 1